MARRTRQAPAVGQGEVDQGDAEAQWDALCRWREQLTRPRATDLPISDEEFGEFVGAQCDILGMVRHLKAIPDPAERVERLTDFLSTLPWPFPSSGCATFADNAERHTARAMNAVPRVTYSKKIEEN